MEILFPNTIQKQIIDITVDGNADGFAIQKEVDSICKLQLIPQLERLLEKYDSILEIIQIDKLTIEITDLKAHELESKLTGIILSKIEEKLDKKVNLKKKPEEISKSSVEEKIVQSLFFYLEKGYLPWWSKVKNTSDWNEKLNYLFNSGYKIPSLEFIGIIKHTRAKERLLKQIQNKFFWKIINQISSKDFAINHQILHDFILDRTLKDRFETVCKEAVLHSILYSTENEFILFSERLVEELKLKKESFEKIFIQTLKLTKNLSKEIAPVLLKMVEDLEETKLASTNQSKDKVEKKSFLDKDVENKLSPTAATAEQNSVKVKDEKTQGIYINNAGLVIVAPLLPMFFKDLELCFEDILTRISKAIALLHFIINGTEDFEEFESVIPKILCGIELEEVIEKVNLNENEKNKATELLLSIIEHWSVLKNTSVKGLQTSFLQREGKLIFKNGQWFLQVSKQSFDVLLENLPWNINMIKLPWMENLLIVEWM